MRKLSLGVLLLATSFSVMACGGKKEAEETTVDGSRNCGTE